MRRVRVYVAAVTAIGLLAGFSALYLLSSAASASGPTILYAYAQNGTPAGADTGGAPPSSNPDCAQYDASSTTTVCDLAAALSYISSTGSGDYDVYLETPSSGSGSGTYIGNWSVPSVGSGNTLTIEPDPSAPASDPTLSGNDGSSTNCETSACDSSILSITPNTTGDVSLAGVTIEDADNTQNEHGGGGIYHDAPGGLSISASTFEANDTDELGGAIDSGDGDDVGALDVSDSTFDDNSSADGGAIDNGEYAGAGALTISDSVFDGNQATGGGDALGLEPDPAAPTGDGGAIDNGDAGGGAYSDLSVTDSTFTDNTAGFDGGAIDNSDYCGHGILFASGDDFHANTADNNGGALDDGDYSGCVSSYRGSATVSDSTFTANSATGTANGDGGQGGAIANAGNVGYGTLAITDSTLSGNTANDDGGAIDNGDEQGHGTLTIADATVSGNAAGAGGGAIDNADKGGEGQTSIASSTLVDNYSNNGYGLQDNSTSSFWPIYLEGTIVANHVPVAGDEPPSGTSYTYLESCDEGKNYVDDGYNIGDDGTCGFSATGSLDDSTAVDATLGTLSANGGTSVGAPGDTAPLDTIAPAGGYPVLGAIPGGTSGATDDFYVSSTPATDPGTICGDESPVYNATGTITSYSGTDENGVSTTDDASGLCAIGAYNDPAYVAPVYAYAEDDADHPGTDSGGDPPSGNSTCGAYAASGPTAVCDLTAALEYVDAEEAVQPQPFDVFLETSHVDGTYIGNWTVPDPGSGNAITIESDPAAPDSDPTLSGNDGDPSGGPSGTCETTACDGSILSIATVGDVSVSGVIMEDGRVTAAGSAGGGDIDDAGTGTVSLSSVSFVNDDAAGDGGAIDNADGVIGGTLNVSGSTFSDACTSCHGGAIDNGDNGGGGTLNVIDSTFSDTCTGCDGGSIDSGDTGGTGTLDVADSTFQGDSATDGGAIDSGDHGGTGTLDIADSTFQGDSATDGGAVDNGDGGGTGRTQISSSTFVDNSASDAAIANHSGAVTLQATIVADGVSGDGTTGAPDCSGGITDAGYNIDDDTSSCLASTPAGAGSSYDNAAIDASLGTPGLNGGSSVGAPGDAAPLETIALIATGADPAVEVIPIGAKDAFNGDDSPGPGTICGDQSPTYGSSGTVSSYSGADERGTFTTDDTDGRCSVGAYNDLVSATFYAYAADGTPGGTDTGNGGSPAYGPPSGNADCGQYNGSGPVCDLAAALTLISQEGPRDYVVYLETPSAGPGSGAYVGNWTVPDPGSGDTITIEADPGAPGSDPTLSGNNGDTSGGPSGACETTACDNSILTMNTAGNVAIADVTMEDANDTAGYAGGAIDDTSTGMLSVSHATFDDDSAQVGGDIANAYDVTGGTLSVADSAFKVDCNNGCYGGAIANGDEGGNGVLNVSDSAFTGTCTLCYVGGISNGDELGNGVLNVSDSTFSIDCGGPGCIGGAVSNGDEGNGTLNVSDSTFADNSAYLGAAIANGELGDGTAQISSSTFVDNSADYDGAIYNAGGTVAMEASLVANNVSGDGGTGSPDCTGTITDDGYNIDDDGTCGWDAAGSSSDNSAVDASLGPLAANGAMAVGAPGDTAPLDTIALLANEADPAFDAVPATEADSFNPGSSPEPGTICGDESPVYGSAGTVGSYAGTDERGNSATADASCSIGSYNILTQTIRFSSNAPGDAKVGGGYSPAAAATSQDTVVFTIDADSTAGACSISGSTVSFTGVGSCIIDANQTGDADYEAAPQVQQSLTVGQGPQIITFTSVAPGAATVGGSYRPEAYGGDSDNPVVFTIDSSSSGCSITNAVVTFTGAGTCVIDANQAGNVNYTAAAQAQQSFAIKALPTPLIKVTSTKIALPKTLKTLPIRLSCSKAACKGVITFTTSKKAKHGTKKVTLGKVKYSLASGKAKKYTLKLSKSDRALFADAHKKRVKVKASIALDGAKTASVTLSVS